MTVVMLDYMRVQSLMITLMQCSMLIEKYKVIYVVSDEEEGRYVFVCMCVYLAKQCFLP